MCRVWGRKEGCTGCRWGNHRERSHWVDQDVDGRIILWWIFSSLEWGGGLDGVGSGLRQVAGTCEYGKEHSGSIKMWGISCLAAKTGRLLKKDFAPWSK
jgi:hypothetical protein